MDRTPRDHPLPLVSVVIPTHNRPTLLGRALRSVEAQTYPSVEIVVVDDASGEPVQLPKSVGPNGFPVHVVRRDERGGPAAARNSAAAAIRGDLVAFLDSDDEWKPEKLDRQVRFLHDHLPHGARRLLICGFERRTGGRTWTVAPPPCRRYLPTDLLACATVPMTASVMLLDADPFRSGDLRFDERLAALEDLDLAVQVASRGTVLCQADVLTVKHRDLDREHAYTDAADLQARDVLAQKYPELIRADRRTRIGFGTRTAVGLLATGRRAEAAQTVRAISSEDSAIARAAASASAAVVDSPASGVAAFGGRALLRGLRASDRRRRTTSVDAPARVAYLLPNLEVGGVQRAHLLIGRYLDRARVEPIFVALHHRDNDARVSLQSVFEDAGLDVRDLGLVRRADRSPAPLLLGAWRLRRLCRREHIDLIDSCIVEADLVARLATLGLRTRHVTHLVSLTYDDAARRQLSARSRLKMSTLQRIDSMSAHTSTAFVALTDAVAASAIEHLRLPPSKVVVIPRGVDLDEFAARPVAAGDHVDFRVLSVGRLANQKGHEETVEAVALLRAAGVDANLTFAGEGPLRRSLEVLAHARGIAAHVTFAGAVDAAMVRELLARADVFCFPSRWEGQGNALLEAMAAGCAIVASDIAPLREVLGDAGVLVATEDARALAAGLQRVAALNRQDRLTMGAAARKRAEARFAANDRVADLASFYGVVLGRTS